ncbi:flavohemoglobin expression-modulating QEGLA motif protein [soil metagenome]
MISERAAKTPDCEDLCREIVAALEEGKGIRKRMGEVGRINIDRPLPFICIYRQPRETDDNGTRYLVIGEASFLIFAESESSPQDRKDLFRSLAKALADKFGAFLVIEVWAGKDNKWNGGVSTASRTHFRIFSNDEGEFPSTVEELGRALRELPIRPEVETVSQPGFAPPGFEPLLGPRSAQELSCLFIGLEVSPIYRDPVTGEVHHATLFELRRNISKAFQQTFFEFVQVQTAERPTQPQMLGSRSVIDAVWAADSELSSLSDRFNYLMAVTPVNATEAFDEFEENQFQKDPVFHYRLSTIDPEAWKRELYRISLQEIEDPTMLYLLREKRIELDRQITLVEDRGTRNFLFESLQLFPPVEDALLSLADAILQIPPKSSEGGNRLGPVEIAALAEMEIGHYRDQYPNMSAKAEIRRDTPPGLMVSQGDLLIGENSSISDTRINALLQHEIGIHSVTYHNGRAQPLKMLYSGMPGYEQLQEGLAVFAEFLVGGLTLGRLRTLAARVIAVSQMTARRSFTEVFQTLHGDYGFGKHSAFNIAMRVFRGGGLTKDAVYLRGLAEVVEYLQNGGDIETLFVGKMGPEHVSIIKELQWREVLKPVPLVPRFMTFPDTKGRLEQIKNGASILDMVAH